VARYTEKALLDLLFDAWSEKVEGFDTLSLTEQRKVKTGMMAALASWELQALDDLALDVDGSYQPISVYLTQIAAETPSEDDVLVADDQGQWKAVPAGALQPSGKIVVSSVMQDTGPGADLVPLSRTYEDGTVRAYTYKQDGLTIDTVAITPPSGPASTWQAEYNAQGVRTHWTAV